MTLIDDKCILALDKRPECVVSENGKTYSLINNSMFIVKQVKGDKCLHQEVGEKRCDYLMIINDKKIRRVFFIELKGGNISEGIKQIMSTIQYLTNELIGYRIDARVIGKGSNIPEVRNTPAYVKLMKKVKLEKGTLEISTNKFYTENI